MFKYDPKDAAPPLIPEGEYEAEIVSAEETVSKGKQEPMLKLGFKVFTPTHEGWCPDYIVSKTLWKLKKICEATGIPSFDAGEIDPTTLQGRFCRVAIRVQRDKTGKYPDSNAIVRYSKSGGAGGAAAVGAPSDDDLSIPEENIPF